LKRKTLILLLLSILLLSPLGCGDDDDDDNSDDDDASDDDDSTDPFDQLVVEWVPCSLYDGLDDGRAECASTEMRFDWDDPDSGPFTSYAKRLLSNSKASEGQLWLLHGGPGASGTIELPPMMEMIQNDNPELDIYTLDPRGSGHSDYVGCPDQEDSASDAGEYLSLDEIPDCIAWLEGEYGDDLGVFNTTNSAIDLAAYIHNTKEDEKNVLIWGGSGGTFWGQRYLQMYPDQADGIVFEGITQPTNSLVFQDEYADKIGRTILQMCAEDAYCSGKMADPETVLVELLDKLDSGHCPSLGIDRQFVVEVIDYLTYYHPHHAVIPAFIYRVDRCDAGDVDAIVHFYNELFGGKKSLSGNSFSYVLFYNEVSSELWEYPDFADNSELLDYLDGILEDAIIDSGKGYVRNSIYLMWNRYEDKLDNKWAETDIPMLMLQGVLDPSTPYDFAVELEDHFTGQHQHFVAFPYAPHNVVTGSPVSENSNAQHCGEKLFYEFLRDPTGPLDTSCADDTLPLDFVGADYGWYFFGTEDYWENTPSTSKGTAPPPYFPVHPGGKVASISAPSP
jgi:pimeloyl-ACP methyl ester carboxylesterase